MKKFSKKEAKEYLSFYFSLGNFEARSYAQDLTDDGCFTEDMVKKFDEETLINVAEDLRYQVRQEIGYLL